MQASTIMWASVRCGTVMARILASQCRSGKRAGVHPAGTPSRMQTA